MQPHLHTEVKIGILKQYREYDFDITEEGDHLLILEHLPCGHKDRFPATGATIESIQEACEKHIGECSKYKEGD